MQPSTTTSVLAPPSSAKQGAISRAIASLVHSLAACMGLGQRGERWRADQGESERPPPNCSIKRPGIFARNGCGRRQHRNEAAPGQRRGRLYGGHRSHDGDGKALAQGLKRDGGCGIAGEHDAIGCEIAQPPVRSARASRAMSSLSPRRAVRKAGIVGDEADIGLGDGCRAPRAAPSGRRALNR